jgi:hypothetical protein
VPSSKQREIQQLRKIKNNEKFKATVKPKAAVKSKTAVRPKTAITLKQRKLQAPQAAGTASCRQRKLQGNAGSENNAWIKAPYTPKQRKFQQTMWS